MTRHAPVLAAAAAVFLLPSVARPAPIVTQAAATLTIRSVEFGSVQVTGNGPVTVDVAGSSLQVPAGLLSQVGTINVPVTPPDVVVSISATGIRNLAGTFTLGGGTGQVAGETCPTGGPSLGSACVGGGGLGGTMGLEGQIRFVIIPNVAAYPLTLSQVRIGLGGSTSITVGPADGAPWTLGTGQVAFTSNFTPTAHTGTSLAFTTGTGSLAAGQLTLVTPTYVQLLGRAVPVVSSLELTFSVPEPGSALLLGLGALGLAGLLGCRGR